MTDAPQSSPEAETTFQDDHRLAEQIVAQLRRVVLGQDAVIDEVMTALLAGGHVLLEGAPGLGKTLLVKALARTFGGRFSRIQFTPDLMPSDVTGHALYNMNERRFEIRRGPVFTHLLLADEINRAPAKTQAALLEVMQEHQVTIEGKSLQVGQPFMVLATQNPIEQEGTYPLPEAELDRFMLKVFIDYPQEQDEIALVQAVASTPSEMDYMQNVTVCAGPEQVLGLQARARAVTLDPAVLSYAVALSRATREHRGLLRGAGPRGAINLVMAARAKAFLAGRDFVIPDDVKTIAKPVLRHRLQLSADMEIEGVQADQVLDQLLDSVAAPRQ
ncbi:AAA family ATPase [Mangrovitalea sediminis]|uniref:AAA family ATPase n=1 Tax=Mangrovitalea sediminis TaxID=1982043 RepID=UPI000BE50998|nr:MoxR family ATPase [Mangrovitalea sediminis]